MQLQYDKCLPYHISETSQIWTINQSFGINVFNPHCSRKYTARLQEQEEQIETLLVKINNLEKQKSRLQSEVEVLIIDLEKVSCNIILKETAQNLAAN